MSKSQDMLPLKQVKCHLSVMLSISRRQWFLLHAEFRVLWNSKASISLLCISTALLCAVRSLAPCSINPWWGQSPQLTDVHFSSPNFKRWMCRTGKLSRANPVWVKVTKHTVIQTVCIPTACCSLRLQSTQGDPPWWARIMFNLSICSSVKQVISYELAFIFSLARVWWISLFVW